MAQLVKNCLQCGKLGLDPWVGKIPWRRERLTTPVFWSGEFHGLYSQTRLTFTSVILITPKSQWLENRLISCSVYMSKIGHLEASSGSQIKTSHHLEHTITKREGKRVASYTPEAFIMKGYTSFLCTFH